MTTATRDTQLAVDPMPTLEAIRHAGAARLEGPVRDFLEGGAGAESTLRANRRSFDELLLQPRLMSGRPAPSTRTEFLGYQLDLPILTAPFGADALFHPDGHLAVARANAAFGIGGIAPEASSYSYEQIQSAAPDAAFAAQLHPMGDPDNFVRTLRRIEAAGYRAVCVTCDCPTGGWRERNLANAWAPPPIVLSGNYPAGSGVDLESVFGQLFDSHAAVWSWDQLSDLMSVTSLPWIAKGILSAHDAEAAPKAGASAVIVSNHGGRQLDSTRASIDALPEIRAALGSDVAIALDSGIRSGTDIVKGIALGADVVVLGRVVAYALAAGGEAAVRRTYDLIAQELHTVLTLLGRGGVADIGPDAVRRSQDCS